MKRYLKNIWYWSKNNWKTPKFFDTRISSFNVFLIISLFYAFLNNQSSVFLIPIIILIVIQILIFRTYLISIIICLLILFFLYEIKKHLYNIYLFSNINGTFQVISIKEKFIEVRNIYNLKFILKKNYDLHLYQLINVNGYLQYSENIYYIDKPSIVYINNFDVRFYIFKFFSSFKNYKEIVIPITFGYTYSKSTLFENANNIGILHFLIISGLHFNLLNNILKKIFKNKKKLIKVILFLFWILTVWSISSNRAILQKILPNKIKNQKIQKETKLLYISVVCLVLHNSLNVGIGYFISFTLSYLFLFFNQKFKIKEKILFMIFLWIISNLFLVINNKNINILSLFINFFLSIFFECFIIMFLVLFWFPFASYFLSDLLYDLVYFLSYFIIHIKIDFLYSKEIFSCVLYGKTMFIMFYYKNNI